MKIIGAYLLKAIRNKYVLTMLALAAWLLFFDKNDIFSQLERKAQVDKLEGEAQYYRNEIARNKQELHELQSNPLLLEKFAREHYFMKKDNEEIYMLVPDTAK